MPNIPPSPQAPSKGNVVTPQKVKYVDGPNYYSFYANNIAFAVNQLDIVLVLGEIIDVNMPEMEAVIERRARVTMAPAQAKFLAKILASAVQKYESQNGPIQDIPFVLPS